MKPPMPAYAYPPWSPASTFDDISTAAPSPAFTVASPPRSPGSSLSEAQSHVPNSDIEGFTLPDAERSGGSTPNFVLSGGNTLRSLLAELVRGEKQKGGALAAVQAHGAPAPPPGLEEYSTPGVANMATFVDLDMMVMQGSLPPSLWTGCTELHPYPQRAAPAQVAVPSVDGMAKAPAAKKTTPVAKQNAKPSPTLTRLPSWCTTAMLRNIPNKYTRDMLTARLHEDGFKYDLDFLYMPVDFKHKCNMGYAFVNFRSPEACARFAAEYHTADSRKKLPGFRSGKVCEVTAARCQGREENVMRLLGSPVMLQLLEMDKPEWLPVVFTIHGECSVVCRPSGQRVAQPLQADCPQRRNHVPRGLAMSPIEG